MESQSVPTPDLNTRWYQPQRSDVTTRLIPLVIGGLVTEAITMGTTSSQYGLGGTVSGYLEGLWERGAGRGLGMGLPRPYITHYTNPPAISQHISSLIWWLPQ